jgi:hypothetical protein
MAQFRIHSKSRVNPESTILSNFKHDVTSQFGEDGIREKIFDIIGTQNKWCVEFGAWDGKLHSMSWSLLSESGWQGVLIEGDANKFTELCQTYDGNDNVYAINEYVGLAGETNCLDELLSATPIPQNFDFLSIDVDGLDWHIWKSLSQYKPRIVAIEFNPTIPNHISFVQDADPSLNHGSSLRAMIELGKEQGYELIATTSVNAFFALEDDFPKFGIKDNSIDAMHDMNNFESFLFQLYDGTLVLLGCDKLIWKDQRITQGDIQVLPPEKRKFL